MDNIETKENTTVTESSAGNDTEQNNEALYQKIDEIAGKRMDGIVKNILKSNGIEDDEDLKNLLNGYKQHRESKATAATTEIETLKRQNAELTNKIKSGEKSAAITKAASELGVSSENVRYIAKLADLSNVEKDGQYDVEAIKAAIKYKNTHKNN